jgi:hypothetical protein
MRLLAAAGVSLVLAAACSKSAPPSQVGPVPCEGTRVLVVQNGAQEAVNVYAMNGRNSTEIGTAAPGRKEITIPANLRATSFYAVAVSRLAIAGSVLSAPADTRVIFELQCR